MEDADMSYDLIMEKAMLKKEKARESRALREEGKGTPLLIERTATGLYTCRYERGLLPDALKGFFTRKSRILDIARERGIPTQEI
jgi:hypothetical protein